MKLSQRLKQLDNMTVDGYDHIWDCCCDHGLLGAALLSRSAANCIHFVDIAAPLMAELEARLSQFFPSSSVLSPDISNLTSNRTLNKTSESTQPLWRTHCMDVAQLPLAEYSGRHLVIIAGVGGDLMQRIMAQLLKRHPQLPLDFLLCPVHHQYAVRQQLQCLNFSLQEERLLRENGRYYELLRVSSPASPSYSQGKVIHSVGDDIWQCNTPAQMDVVQTYLTKVLTHYQRIQDGGNTDVTAILQRYRLVDLLSSGTTQDER